MNYAKELLTNLGPLRLILLLTALAAVVIRPAPGTPASLETWGFIYTVVIPVVATITFVLLLLDALMARIFLSASETDAMRRRLRIALIANLLGAGALLVAWTPYMLALRQN